MSLAKIERGTLDESNVATLEDKKEIELEAPIVTQKLVGGPLRGRPTHSPEEQAT
jgi:hypothetical protein